MSKRRLSQQQRTRIRDRQDAHSDNSGSTGLVISHFGKEVDIAPVDENHAVALDNTRRCHFRATLPTLVCGDLVKFSSNKGDDSVGVVESILTRQTLIERPRPYQPPKPVAANVDTIVLVISVEPLPIASLIDRYLVAADNAGLSTILLINKHDKYLELTRESTSKQEIDQLIELYVRLGYACYFGSAEQNSVQSCVDEGNTEALSSLFSKRKSVLVGQSGVGKSSIINTIIGCNVASIGNISDATTKGKHTTTTARLYFLDQLNANTMAGSIIDSPGIREFGLWHLDKQQVINGMPEFRELAQQCKFRDCDHEQSKGCAIQHAIQTEAIDSTRLSSYYQIMESLQENN